MVHLRIVAPSHSSEQVLELLERTEAVCNIVFLERAARSPEGDVILCDVGREEASVLVGDLRELDIDVEGSVAIERVESEISPAAATAGRSSARLARDAVVWEDVEARASDSVELSPTFLFFMAIATTIASVGIYLDQTILIVGAMVVGPDFGPIAGICVAAVQRRAELARRSGAALAIGFPLAIAVTFVITLVLKELAVAPSSLGEHTQVFTRFIADPDFFSFFVAFLAGVAGVLSLTTEKSGALIGVVISVATIPAAANMSVAAAYAEWAELGGAAGQLGVNLASLLAAGILTLFVQRRLYVSRRRRHLGDPARQAAGLPVGRSRRARGPATGEPEAR